MFKTAYSLVKGFLYLLAGKATVSGAVYDVIRDTLFVLGYLVTLVHVKQLYAFQIL